MWAKDRSKKTIIITFEVSYMLDALWYVKTWSLWMKDIEMKGEYDSAAHVMTIVLNLYWIWETINIDVFALQ